jgi:tetratricopeptide (TPR) repeat protein
MKVVFVAIGLLYVVICNAAEQNTQNMSAEAYLVRSGENSDKGNLDQALADCGKAVELKPNWAEAYYNLGLLYGEKDEAGLAISAYEKAIELKPNYAEAFLNRGLIYLAMAHNGIGSGDYVKAIVDFTKAIEIKADYAEAYQNRAVAHYFSKDYAKTWDDMKMAQKYGYNVPADFVEQLKKDSGREE